MYLFYYIFINLINTFMYINVTHCFITLKI